MYTLDFSKSAEKVLATYKQSNKAVWNKCVKILHELAEHPKTGQGKPEPLVGGNMITYSRRLDKGARIIYDIYEDEVRVLVIDVEGYHKK